MAPRTRSFLLSLALALFATAFLLAGTTGCNAREKHLQRLHGTWAMSLTDTFESTSNAQVDGAVIDVVDLPPEIHEALQQLRMEMSFFEGGRLQLVAGPELFEGRWTAPEVERDRMTLVVYIQEEGRPEPRRIVERVTFDGDDRLQLIDDDGNVRTFRRLHGASAP